MMIRQGRVLLLPESVEEIEKSHGVTFSDCVIAACVKLHRYRL